jgi:F0F1-type ATP synthase membrane subunit b/b'
VSFDASILVIMVIFWITYLILRFSFFKPIVALLDEREGRVTTAQQTWEEAHASTQKRLDEERALLGDARRKAMAARADRRREAQERRLQILAEVKKAVQQELGEASSALQSQVRSERQVLDQHSRALADEIVRRLLGTAA